MLPVIGLLAFASPVMADQDNSPSPNQNGHSGIKNPEEHGKGERGEYRHRISEDEEHGFEAIQFVLIGGALVIAILLAYNAGKRNRKKRD